MKFIENIVIYEELLLKYIKIDRDYLLLYWDFIKKTYWELTVIKLYVEYNFYLLLY